MNKRFMQRALALWLASCFLVVSTTLATTITSHAQHHAHDQQTHTQTWCGWMCAAGQAIETPSIQLIQYSQPVGWATIVLPSIIPLFLTFSPGSRDPPVSSYWHS